LNRFTILVPAPADIDTICVIETACHLSPWSPEAYLSELDRSDSIVFKAESDGGKIIGFILGRMVAGIGFNERDAEIYNIGVHPDFEGQGAGSQLLNRFLGRCKELVVASLWLEVRESNSKAIRFYSGKGFTKQGTRKSFYRDPVEDAVIMRLSVRSEAS